MQKLTTQHFDLGNMQGPRRSNFASHEGSRSNGTNQDHEESRKADAMLWLDSFIAEINAENQVLPIDHPVSIKMNAMAHDLRMAAQNDPLLRSFGVFLPDIFHVCVLVSKTPAAFIYPERPDCCYITTELINQTSDPVLLMAILAHEQSHSIYSTLAKQTELSPNRATSRYGEPIWRDQLGEKLAVNTAREMAIQSLTSSEQELWCDTHGSFALLDACNVSPQAVEAALARAAKDSPNLRTVSTSLLDGARLSIVSHPYDPHRIWVARAMANRSGYPAQLRNPRHQEASSLFVQEASERIQQTLNAVKEPLEWILAATEAGDSPEKIFPVSDPQDPKHGPPRCQGLTCYSHFLVTTALKEALRGNGPLGNLLSDSEQLRNVSAHEAKGYRKLFDNKSDSTESILDEIIEDQKQANDFTLWERLLLDDQQARQKIVDQLQPEDLFSLGDKLPNIDFDCEQLASAIMGDIVARPYYTIGRLSRGCLIFERSVSLTKFEQSLWESTIADELSVACKETPRKLVKKLINDCLNKWAKDGTFPEIDTFLEWLQRFEETQRITPCALGPFSETPFIFQLAHDYALQSSKDNKELAARLRAVAKAGFQPGLTYAEYRGGKAIPFKAPILDNNGEPTPYFQLIKELWPQYADGLLINASHRNTPSELMLYTEPVKLQRNGAEVELINLHDQWAVTAKLPGLQPALIRGNADIDSFLEKLRNVPHHFSPSIWRSITKEAVHSHQDLNKLVSFVTGEFTPPSSAEFPYLDRTRIENLAAIIREGLDKLSHDSGFVPNDYDLKEWGIGLISQIPRHSIRNEVVHDLLELLVQRAAPTNDLVEIARFVETEPLSAMLRELADEVRKTRNKDCYYLEEVLSNCEKFLIKRDRTGIVKKIDLYGTTPLPGILGEFEVAVDQLDLSYGIGKTGESKELLLSVLDPSGNLNSAPPKTPTELRYALLCKLESLSPAPTESLSSKTQSLESAEKIASIILTAMRVDDPAEHIPFTKETSTDDFTNYCHEVIFAAQPAPTPLRDTWLMHAIECFEGAGGQLSLEELQDLQQQLYLPENIEQLGEKIWHLISSQHSDRLTVRESLDQLIDHCPYYSLRRNKLLEQLRRELSCDYQEARLIANYEWIPGYPPARPNAQHIGAHAAIDFQVSLLEGFEDFDKVEFILYTQGVLAEKPWAVCYMERFLGRSLENIKEVNDHLDSGVRSALLHKIFGGHDGIFTRGNGAALTLLARQIADELSEAIAADESTSKLINAVSEDIFLRAGFSVHVRTEVLAALTDWLGDNRSGPPDDRAAADLITRIFKAAGPPGVRFLQGLKLEPELFPPGIRHHLAAVQDDVGYGHVCTPFHTAQAQGVDDLRLGAGRGAASMAEVHRIISVGGDEINGVVGKFSRPETVSGIEVIGEPMKKVARTIGERVGHGWGERLVDGVIDSCRIEGRRLSEEANRNSPQFAARIASALGGAIINDAGRCYVQYHPLEDTPIAIEIPQRVILPGEEECSPELASRYFFALTDLGDNFQSISHARYQAEEQNISVSDYCGQFGADLEALSAANIELFFSAFLNQGILFKDLHSGNAGFTIRDDGTCIHSFLDFGGVQEDFPEYWKNWLVRVSLHGAAQDSTALKRDLLEGALLSAGGQDNITPACLVDLEQFLARLSAVRNEASTASLMLNITETVEFIVQKWPLPPEVRDFGEGLRKVIREWLPNLSSETLNVVGERIAGSIFETIENAAEGLQPDTHLSAQIDEIIQPATPAQNMQRAGSPDDLAWFRAMDCFPQDTTVHYLSGDGEWQQFELIEEHSFNTSQLRGRLKGIMLSDRSQGYLEWSDGGETYRIRFDQRKQL